MTRNTKRKPFHLPGTILLAALLGSTALVGLAMPAVANTTWTGAVSDDWFDVANWTNGLPVDTVNETTFINSVASNPTLLTGADGVSYILYVGSNSSTNIGHLTITNAMLTVGGWTSVGGLSASGTIVVGSDGRLVTNGLEVGRNGHPDNVSNHGTLEIKDGGRVDASRAAIGSIWGNGTVTATGGGSQFNVANELRIGSYLSGGGRGVVTISAGAEANAGSLIVGLLQDGIGELTVTGPGSTLTISNDADIGVAGTASLTVGNGGIVSVGNGLRVGAEASGQGAVIVTGQNSRLDITGRTIVGGTFDSSGQAGQGYLTISDRGRVESGEHAYIASGTTATSDFARVDVRDIGSQWIIQGTLAVGRGGLGMLTISDHGLVASNSGVIADFMSSGRSMVAVDGAGSEWSLGSQLTVGRWGEGYLSISNGGLVDVNSGMGAVLVAHEFDAAGHVMIGGSFALDGTISGPTAAGTLAADNITFGTGSGGGALYFNHTDTNYQFDLDLFGNGAVKHLAGVTRYTGNANTLLGPVEVLGGTLIVDGVLGSAGHVVSVQDGGTLTGAGATGASVQVADGGALVGHYGDTLTIGGTLVLHSGSIIEANWGAPGGPLVLFDVGGDLFLDGTLNVVDMGGFGPGLYRLFNYGGTLTDNGLEIGTVPGHADPSQLTVQFAAGQVNISSIAPYAIAYWDGDDGANWNNGAVDGGSGIWNGAVDSFTSYDGTTNGPLDPSPGFAIFQGTGGIVTVDNGAGQAQVTGMQFVVDGYEIEGDSIELVGSQSIIRVGDGTLAGAGYGAIIASDLFGSATLVKNDLGLLHLQGNNSYTGGTILNGGMLIGDAASIRGDVDITSSSAILGFIQNVDASYEGAILGVGNAVKSGAATLTLAGPSNVDWAVEEGTLIADATQFTGNVTMDIYGNTRFAQTGNAIYGGVITGQDSSQLFFDGGHVVLTANSGGFIGVADVLSGTLEINGNLGGNLTVRQNATLMGSGFLGSDPLSLLSIEGTIRPSGPDATLAVYGNLILSANSTFIVDMNDQGQAGQIAVDGTAYLFGGSVVTVLSGSNFAASTDYTILTATGGVDGTFGGVSSSLVFLDAVLTHNVNDVVLTLARNSTDFSAVGDTPNQAATGAGVESLGAGNDVYDAVLNLDEADARHAFDQLSGEVHASAKSAMIEESGFIRDAINNRIRAAFGDASAMQVPILAYGPGGPELDMGDEQLGTLWMQGFGAWSQVESDGNAARFVRDSGGLLAGADAFYNDWRIGILGGYGRSGFAADDRSSSGLADSWHLGLYGGTEWGNVAFRSGLAYSWHDISTSRTVTFPGFAETLAASYQAGTMQAFGEFGYRFDLTADTTLEPFANLAHISHGTGAFTETGGSAALSAAAQTINTTFATLGLRASHGMTLGAVDVTARGMVGWRHAFGDAPTSTHAILGGDAFTVAGAPLAGNAALVDAGLDFSLAPTAIIGFTYSGQFATGTSDQAIKANLNVKF